MPLGPWVGQKVVDIAAWWAQREAERQRRVNSPEWQRENIRAFPGPASALPGIEPHVPPDPSQVGPQQIPSSVTSPQPPPDPGDFAWQGPPLPPGFDPMGEPRGVNLLQRAPAAPPPKVTLETGAMPTGFLSPSQRAGIEGDLWRRWQDRDRAMQGVNKYGGYMALANAFAAGGAASGDPSWQPLARQYDVLQGRMAGLRDETRQAARQGYMDNLSLLQSDASYAATKDAAARRFSDVTYQDPTTGEMVTEKLPSKIAEEHVIAPRYREMFATPEEKANREARRGYLEAQTEQMKASAEETRVKLGQLRNSATRVGQGVGLQGVELDKYVDAVQWFMERWYKAMTSENREVRKKAEAMTESQAMEEAYRLAENMFARWRKSNAPDPFPGMDINMPGRVPAAHEPAPGF